MSNKIDYNLYLCTDRDIMSCATIEQSVEDAIKGGVTVVQLREKKSSSGDFYNLAIKVKAITDKYNVPLIINDRADIAMAVDCAGVHVGQSDLPCKELRKFMGNKLIGVSASTIDEALQAKADGADYLGIGAMYATNTKTDTHNVSKEQLIEIRDKVKLPMVVIGGINKETLLNFKGIGVDGIAVISAIVAQPDITAAAKEIYALWKN